MKVPSPSQRSPPWLLRGERRELPVHLDGLGKLLKSHFSPPSASKNRRAAAPVPQRLSHHGSTPGVHQAFGGRGPDLAFLMDNRLVSQAGPFAPRPRPHFRPDCGHVPRDPASQTRLFPNLSRLLSEPCLSFASLPPEVGRLSLSGYGSRSGVRGRTGEAEGRPRRWGRPWRSWCRGRTLRWA